ncbi:MAG: hypothetical protein NTW41_12105 [Verrucomicrobia bacterium]|nr:hypothetical protein [Verrucomicrobiota bacterium]
MQYKPTKNQMNAAGDCSTGAAVQLFNADEGTFLEILRDDATGHISLDFPPLEDGLQIPDIVCHQMNKWKP